MGLLRRSKPAVNEEKTPRSVLAAAVNIGNVPAAWKARAGEDTWQKDAWYYYDAIGELRFATNWIANAVSLADMYVAEIDPDTGLITGPTDNNVAKTILSSVFGGAAKRSQAQATMALNWQVGGEVFILIRSRRALPDEWLVLSSTEVSERGGTFTYCDPVTGGRVELNPSTDLLIRLWSPHPRYQSHADSPVRAALPILREIERTTMNIASRLDSRLAGAGVWVIPKELDFPGGDDLPEGPTGIMEALRRAAEASLRNPGEASAQVPIILDVPAEYAQSFNYQTFATELTAEVLELRPAAIKRLGTTLDMPAEIIEGMGGANHWSAWQIEEGGYKIHIAPVLDRFADALTVEYLQPALLAAGVQNPGQYVIAFDTTAIRTRPNRQAELLELHDRILVSDESVRTEAGIPDDDIPTDEERDRRFVEKLVLQDTSLLSDSGIREILGLPEIVVQEPDVPQNDVPQIESAPQNEIPQRVAQSEESSDSNGITAAAEAMVWDALSRAGGRLLTREYRGRFSSTPKHELHTVIKGSPSTALEGSFQFVDAVAPLLSVDPKKLRSQLYGYCSTLITEQRPYNRQEMREWLGL